MNTKEAQKLYELCMGEQPYLKVEQMNEEFAESVDWSDSNPSIASVSSQQEEE